MVSDLDVEGPRVIESALVAALLNRLVDASLCSPHAPWPAAPPRLRS